MFFAIMMIMEHVVFYYSRFTNPYIEFKVKILKRKDNNVARKVPNKEYALRDC